MAAPEKIYLQEPTKEAAQNTFNSMPYDVRKKLANGYERLLEVEMSHDEALEEAIWYCINNLI